jgi:hypothetical protein
MPTLIGEKIEGSINTRIGKNGILLREQTHTYTVLADNRWQDRAQIIFNTPGLPRYGAVYTGGLTVKSINADRTDEHDLRWKVTVVGSTEVEEDQESKNQNSGNTSSDPTTWIPIASVKFETYDEVLKEDVNGKKWVNSAKKTFETGFIRQRRVAVVPFSQFEPISTTLEDIMDRCDTINSVIYKGKAIKTLLLSVENATIGTYSGIRCWRVDYSMRYKKDDWRLKQLDVGYGHYVSGTFTPFLDSDGNQYLGSLDGNGAKVADEENDDPETLYFEQFEAIDFNSFLKVLFT